MKFYFRNGCIALCAAAFLFACKPQATTHPESSSAEPDSIAQSAVKDLKIAFIYGDSINEHYDFLIDAQAELEAEQARIDRQMQNKLKKAQARAAELQQQAPTMTQQQMQAAQLELQRLDLEMQQHQEKLTNQYLARERELQKEYINKIDTFLADYNADGTYDMIFNYQQGGNLLLINQAFDITQEVLTGLNAAYQKQLDNADAVKAKK